MFAAPDVYGSDEALLNIIPNLAPDARMVAFGAKLSTKGVGKLMSPLISGLCRLSFSTTPQPDLEPWKVIEKYLDNVIVEEHFFGLMFIVSGQLKEPKES